MVQQGEPVMGALGPRPFAGISSWGEVILRRAEVKLLIKVGTQAPSRATGSWTPSTLPSKSPRVVWQQENHNTLLSGWDWTHQPPPSLNQHCTPLTLLCNDISVWNAKPHTHTHTNWHFSCSASDWWTPLLALSSAELNRWLSGFRLQVEWKLPLCQMCNQKNVVTKVFI